ncbi:hypothetical protein HYC85_006536 [Camellia sinensis]|uniref:Uncharacterized protein n=1 Tax=Camellia sinensis TaxID=4442 RepID=A0A7J7HLC8_CAMSI|nr:hypothetical protein HYC85_006536 [Camellia sinensis]
MVVILTAGISLIEGSQGCDGRIWERSMSGDRDLQFSSSPSRTRSMHYSSNKKPEHDRRQGSSNGHSKTIRRSEPSISVVGGGLRSHYLSETLGGGLDSEVLIPQDGGEASARRR